MQMLRLLIKQIDLTKLFGICRLSGGIWSKFTFCDKILVKNGFLVSIAWEMWQSDLEKFLKHL